MREQKYLRRAHIPGILLAMSEESLGFAVFTEDLPRVRLLLTLGADPDEPWGTGTPLLQVVDEPTGFFTDSDAEIAEALLDAGAAVNATNADGMTPIHAATRAGPAALALLIRRGADPNLRTVSTGSSPLHFAVDEENVASVEFLLANGADRTLVDNAGHTPLDIALHAANEFPSDELTLIVTLLDPPEH